MWLTLLAAVAPLAGAPERLAVVVQGSSLCPRPEDVAAELPKLLPPVDGTRMPSVAQLERHADGVRLELRSPAGDRVLRRLLPRRASCAAAATAAAVTIAAWESDLAADFLPPVPPPAAPVPLVGPMNPAPALLEARPANPAKAPPTAYEVGVGATFSRSSSWGPGFAAVAAVTPGGRGVGFHCAFTREASRTAAVDTGRARWSRVALMVGVHHRWAEAAALLDGRLGAGVTRTKLDGQGFSANFGGDHFSPALAGGVRLGWRGRSRPAHRPVRVVPWLEVGGTFSLRAERALVLPAGVTWTLPRLAVVLGTGLSVGYF